MGGSPALFEPDPSEPLGLWLTSAASRDPVRRVDFELSSRGDRVPGRLLLPPSGRGPFPLILLQHGFGGSKDAPYIDAVAGPWVDGGAAVASIDFPLHGERANAKFAVRLLSGRSSSDVDCGLRLEFARQGVIDLRRTLDALQSLAEIDAGRIAYAGFSLGTLLGATFCAHDARPRAAALAIGGAGFGAPEIDPARHIGAFAPRPLLFVNATRDETIPRESAEALFAAAGEPKEIQWFDSTHSELPGTALKAMWLFLRRHLDLKGGR